MKLPPTPEQVAWLKRQRALTVTRRKSTDQAKRCATCVHMRAHPFSKRYNYCAQGSSSHTPNGMAKTKRNNVCEHWKGKA